MSRRRYRTPSPVVSAAVLFGLLILHCPTASGAPPRVRPEVRARLAAEGRAVVLVHLRDGGPEAAAPARDEGATTGAARRSFRRAAEDLSIAIEARLAERGARVRYRYRSFPCFAAELRDAAACDLLETLDGVTAVEADEPGEGALLESAAFIHAPEVHQMGFLGDGTTVAVLDSGVDTDHPTFQGAIIHQYHFLDQGADVGPGAEDDNGHGTNVTGIVASRGDTAPLGIAPGAKVVVVKVLNAANAGWLSDWAAGVDHVVALADSGTRVDVINMSLVSKSTFEGVCDDQVTAFAAACSAARERGIVVVAASGNKGLLGALSIPACYSTVVSVGSVKDSPPDVLSSFTNRNALLDLLAPGETITSAGMGGGTSTYSGTSQAAPHVAAVACLLRQVDPGISPAEVEDLMRRTGRPFEDVATGLRFPILDAKAAVEARLVPSVTDLVCSMPADRLLVHWDPLSGIDRFEVRIRLGGELILETYVAGTESSFEWSPPSLGLHDVSVTPRDAAGHLGLASQCSLDVRPHAPFLRGDCSSDGELDVSDAIAILGRLFTGGAVSVCTEACDANDDDRLDISDAIYSLGYLFLGGAPPPPPFGSCGLDPNGPALGCEGALCP